MALAALDHFLIRTENLRATKTFYVDILGLTEGRRPPFPFPGTWLYLGNVPCVHLIEITEDVERATYQAEEARSLSTESGTGAVDHIEFRGTGLAGFLKRFETQNVSYRERSVQGLIQIFVEDPNGVTIELNFDDSETGSRARS